VSSDQTWQILKEQVRKGVMVRSHSGLVQPGEVFVALPGTKINGAAFISEAVARKAGFVVAAPGQWTESPGETVFIEQQDPREALGELAAAHYGTDQDCPLLVGVTGTNGKTTVVHLLHHLLTSTGLRVGKIGTVGVTWPGGSFESGMTTPDCWTLHHVLSRMRDAGVEYVCMEVSSHALDQKRTAGLRFEAAVLTNLTQDHLDYHTSMEDYYQAKAKLFAPSPKEPRYRVVNADDDSGRRLLNQWGGMGYSLKHSGCAGNGCLLGTIRSCNRNGLELHMEYGGHGWGLHSGLVGRHNAANLLAAQGVGLCLGLQPKAMVALQDFTGVPGRLERIANPLGLDIFVDYAHTPDALDNVLCALRELHFVRLIVVFGCGGNRDRTKRPLMGQAVCRWADVAVLTSDNPRNEDPEMILNDVLPGLMACSQVVREADRKRAIQLAIEMMRPGDVLLVAGKGHESTQQIGNRKIPFHDPTVIQAVIREVRGCA
jgi:UDP-N-acetylmuramoyl-L-alanyl-D-glutamate--2,6-diaminopimelate ligase